MLRGGYRPGEGTMLGTHQRTGAVEDRKEEPRGPDNCFQIMERPLCGERVAFIMLVQVAG